MRNRWIVVIVGLLSVMLLAVGCQAAETPTPTPEASLEGRFQVESPGEPVPDEEPVVAASRVSPSHGAADPGSGGTPR